VVIVQVMEMELFRLGPIVFLACWEYNLCTVSL